MVASMDANTGENVVFKNLKTPVEKLQFAATAFASIHFVLFYRSFLLKTYSSLPSYFELILMHG